ncbi:PIN domain-containing protein [Flavobacterium sp.]|jgi:predicted nucleic acid-binding protein|uniref:PIN domain-containing protein n=1 Tax=Flavobacterium sp. TaxID=239 RepID=UPI0037BEAB8A
MKNVLIDTDVILDFFLDREPFSENAAAILSMCEKNEIAGFVTPVIISNVYYILSQENKQEKVLDKLKNLLLIIDVLVIDKTTILVALNSHFKDFEDALQNFTAELNGAIDLIITKNTKDYKKSQIGVMSPVAFLKII